jgi:hypothetical protein
MINFVQRILLMCNAAVVRKQNISDIYDGHGDLTVKGLSAVLPCQRQM